MSEHFVRASLDEALKSVEDCFMDMIQLYQNYHEFLQAELEKRQRSNSRYSLRAFSRDLGISPSNLSEILQKKAGLSPAKGLAVAENLNLNPKEMEHFLTLVKEGRHQRAELKEQIPTASMRPRLMLVLEVLSQWHHFAILELSDTLGFKRNPLWISQRLELPEKLVSNSLKKLERLGLISLKSKKFRTAKVLRTPDEFPSALIRKYHQEMLELAKKKIDQRPVSEREFSSSMIPFDSEKIDEAKEFLRNMRSEFNRRFGGREDSDSVYAFNFQLFEISKELPEQKNQKRGK